MSQQTQDRRWEIDLEVDEFGNVDLQGFEDRLHQEHAALAAIEMRLGGAAQSYVIRQQDRESGLWYPVKAVFKWQSFVPGIRAPKPQPAPAPAPEPEVDLSEEIGNLEPDAGPEFAPPRQTFEDAELDAGRAPEPGEAVEEGQLFEKNGELRIAADLNQQNELLADGWKPVETE